MKRGALGNTGAPDLWILSSVVFVKKPAPWYYPWAAPEYTLDQEKLSWLWSISHGVRLICIWIGSQPTVSDPYFVEHRSYDSVREAVAGLRRDSRAIELITDNEEDLGLGQYVRLWTSDSSRYRR